MYPNEFSILNQQMSTVLHTHPGLNGLKVFVINLARSEGRRNSMESQLQKLGVPFEFITAIDGQRLTAQDLMKYSRTESVRIHGRELSPGEIGCALSHLNIYERMLQFNHHECLILEDDINIGAMLINILEHRSRLPLDWELINFYTTAPEVPFGEPIIDIYRPTLFRTWANGAAAYLINAKGVKKLLQKAYPIRFASDGLTGRVNMTGLISYGIYPRVVTLQEVESTIGGSR